MNVDGGDGCSSCEEAQGMLADAGGDQACAVPGLGASASWVLGSSNKGSL